jgi:hypothetical protein
LKDSQDFSDPSFEDIQRISTEAKALLAAVEVQKRLKELEVIKPSIEIVNYHPFGYEIHVSGILDGVTNNSETLDEMLNRIGVKSEKVNLNH